MNRYIHFAIIVTSTISANSYLADEARAQAPTYVGSFAMTCIKSGQCATNEPAIGAGGQTTFSVNREPWAADPGQEWAFLLLPNKYYAIFNVKTGLFLAQSGANFPFGGGGIIQTAWTADLSQQWYLYPFGQNVYAIVNVQSGQMLTDPSTATTSGSALNATTWSSDLRQLWYLYFLFK